MTTTVHLAVYDTLADWEAGHAIAGLNDPQFQREPGRYTVRTVAAGPDPITTMGGVRIVPDLTLADLDADSSALLILPGAHLWDTGGGDEWVDVARAFLADGTAVAAICGATGGLARGGLLDDRSHTSNAPEYLAMTGYAGGALYRDEAAVRDRGLITAGAMHPVDFAHAIFAELDVYDAPILEAWRGLHRTGDPVWFEKLMAAAA